MWGVAYPSEASVIEHTGGTAREVATTETSEGGAKRKGKLPITAKEERGTPIATARTRTIGAKITFWRRRER